VKDAAALWAWMTEQISVEVNPDTGAVHIAPPLEWAIGKSAKYVFDEEMQKAVELYSVGSPRLQFSLADTLLRPLQKAA
jgi:hypothetical protein